MKLWPFGKLETRQEGSYTNALIASIVSRVSGKSLVTPSATAALEACAGTVGRAFMAAEIGGPEALTQAFTPSIMEMIGRALIREDQIVFLLDTSTGMLRLIPAQSWDIEGGPFPSDWSYRLTLGGPSRTLTYDHVPADSVIDLKYGCSPTAPWRGYSPLDIAALSGKLSAETIGHLADEASGPVGRLLGVPQDGEDSTVQGLKQDIANAKGRTALLETGDWDNQGGGARVDLQSRRFGAEPPASLVDLADFASREVFPACGFNANLFGTGQAAALREAWRLALFGVLAPLGRLVQSEIRAKLNAEITIGWRELRASDLCGRARAMQSMVNGGMSVVDAVAGLMVED